MRTGSWLLTAGLALLALGIVTAPKIKHEPLDRTLTFPAQNIDMLDLDLPGMENIVLGDVSDITLNYRLWYRHTKTDEPTISSSTAEGVLSLKTTQSYWNQAILTAPSTFKGLRSHNLLFVTARHPVDTLRLEGRSVHWRSGDANVLDIHLHAQLDHDCTRSSSQSKFTFEHGKVALLRIHASTGTVVLEYVDQVGDIELHAGPSVRVQARHGDLSRIRILPLADKDLDETLTKWERCREEALSAPAPAPGSSQQ